MTMAKVKKVSQYLCPGCEKGVKRDAYAFGDKADRPWHSKCVKDMLAKHFRTPLSPVEATAAVEFECEGGSTQCFMAPYSFHLREIVFEDDVEITNVFVGESAVIFTQMGTMTIRSQDLEGRRLVIDHDVPMNFGVLVNAPNKSFKWRLLGERRSENNRPKPSSKQVIAVGSLRSEDVVMPGEAIDLSFAMPVKFYGQRLVCDDWQDWQVISVKLGVDPGTHVLQDSPLSLEGVSTVLPTYTARPGERVTYCLQNSNRSPRWFIGRVYGTVMW